jgi:hypothetical protein
MSEFSQLLRESMGKKKNAYKVLAGNLKEKGIDGKVLLRWIWKQCDRKSGVN